MYRFLFLVLNKQIIWEQDYVSLFFCRVVFYSFISSYPHSSFRLFLDIQQVVSETGSKACWVSDNKVQRLVDRKGVLKLRFLSRYLRQKRFQEGLLVLFFWKKQKVFLLGLPGSVTKGFLLFWFCTAGLGARSSIKGFSWKVLIIAVLRQGVRRNVLRFLDFRVVEGLDKNDGTKFDIEKFDGTNDFALWKVKMKTLLEQQRLAAALEELPASTIVAYDNVIQKKAFSALILCLVDRVLREITKETTATGIWKKLDTLYMTKSLANRLYLKKKLYTFQMHQSKSQSKHIDEFHKLVGDLAAIDIAILDEDQALLLLTSLPSSYDNFVETLLYGRDTLKLEDIMDSRGFYHMAYKRVYLFDFEEYNGGNVLLSDSRKCRVRGTCKVQVQMRDGSSFMLDNVRYVPELRRNLLSLGTRKANSVYTFDGQAVTRKTLKGRKQLGEYQAARKIKIDNVLYSCNQSIKQVMLEPVKVKCIFLGYHEGIVGDKIWKLDDVTSKGVEFEVKSQEDHAFEVKPQGNVHHVAGSQKEQTQDLICYHLARDKEQCLAHEPLRFREDNNDAAFAVAAVEKIYAHESLTFNYTVTCDAEMWVTKGLLDKTKGNVLGMEIVRDQSGSLSRDCDVEKNGKWLCIYAVRSQEYQMVCTRLNIASVDVGSWEAMMPHMMALLTTEAGCMTFTYAWKKEAIWLKRLFGESEAELKLVAVFATGFLIKADPDLRFHYILNVMCIGRLLPHARGLGFKPRRGGFPSEAKKEWGLSPKAKVRVLNTAQLDVTVSSNH
nr:retrovirus-related Pol polyprotein from transposon TNT 1-94 [Tanacetum cinerariifolium]